MDRDAVRDKKRDIISASTRLAMMNCMEPKEVTVETVGEYCRLFEWLVLMRPEDYRTVSNSQLLYVLQCVPGIVYINNTWYVLIATK